MKKKEEQKVDKKTGKKESEIVTKESLCAVCALFSLLAFLILCTRSLIFGDAGAAVHGFLTGLLGYMAYPTMLVALYFSLTTLIGKSFIKNRKAFALITLTVISAALIVHTATTFSWEAKGYLSECFKAGERFPAATPTGWIGALLVLAVFSVTSKVGAIVIFSILTLFFAYLTVIVLKKRVPAVSSEEQPTVTPVEIPVSPVQGQAYEPQAPVAPVEAAYAKAQPKQEYYPEMNMPQRPQVSLSDERAPAQSQQANGAFSPFGTPQTMRQTPEQTTSAEDNRAFLFGGTPAENYRRNLIFDPNANVNKRPAVNPAQAPIIHEGASSYANEYQNSVNDETVRPLKIFEDRTQETQEYDEPLTPLAPIPPQPTFVQEPIVETPTPVVEQRYTESYEEETQEEEIPVEENSYRRHEYMDLFSPANPNVFGNETEDRALADEAFNRTRDESERAGRGIDIFDEKEEETDGLYTLRSNFEETREPAVEDAPRASERLEVELPPERGRDVFPVGEEEKQAEPAPAPTPEPPPPPKPRVIRPYVRVPIDDFDCRDVEPTANQEEVEETKANIIATLDDYKVNDATIASVTFGPTVTRYNVAIPRNIPPKKVVALDQPIAISLHSSGVNIYPNYEDGVVSIEVPNKDRQFVQLGCMLTGDTFVNSKPSSLMFAMGKDAGNRKIYGDISKMIHLLVAGASGSGKSVFLGSLIISLIYKYSPEELRLILIDPKKTEFVLYNNLPHLMINEIITDANKAVQSLNWAIGEMNRRYGLFEQMSRAGTYVVNLDQYNAQLKKEERLPKIVIIIDELADLMLAAKKDIEDRVQNLTQKARAAGIHLIVATQRPSTDVITGVIKSNLPTRIAFGVATEVDSRVILDQTGAHKLLGKGDFLYTMQGINTPVRVQSAFISAEDSQRVVNFIKANNEAYYDESATTFINNARGGSDGGSGGSGDEVEAVYIEALRYVIVSGSASISMIQRKCSVGYNKAGKIVEWMEDMGYISSFDGAKARKVLITKEEFESIYGTF